MKLLDLKESALKIQELQEMALSISAAGKEKRLKQLFPLETINDHYEMVIALLAGKLSFANLDELEAKLGNSIPDESDINFHLTIMLKKLQKYLGPASSILNGFSARLNTPILMSSGRKVERYIDVEYKSGKWQVLFYVNGPGWANKRKKFDTAKDAMVWAERMLTKMEADPSWW